MRVTVNFVMSHQRPFHIYFLIYHIRKVRIKTKNDSTRFLADFGRLMFGSFEAKHLDREWHRELHKEDRVLYFPKELFDGL